MKFPKNSEKFDYWDLRVLNNHSETLSVQDSNVNALNVDNIFHVGLRVINQGSWAFVSSNKMDLKSLFAKALKISKIKGLKIKLPEKKIVKKNYSSNFKVNPFKEPVEKKIKILKELNSEIKSYSKKIRTAESILAYNQSELDYFDSQGSSFNSKKLLSRYFIKGVALNNGDLQQAFERDYITGGLENFYDAGVQKISSTIGERVIRLLKAKHAPAKKFPIVCDNEMTGLFFHEAVGHACEADIVIKNASVLKNKIGKKVASDLITFSDYSGPEKSFGRVVVDDEGVKKKETVLIENGILKNYLHSLHTAALMGVEPTGNGRSMSAQNFPIPRMTTLKIKTGSWKENELISEVKKGVLVKGFKGGEVNPTEGNFVFAASEAFMIRNGEVAEPLRDVTVSGSINKTMHKISGVSKKLKLNRGGICGKGGQHVPVNEVMPCIKIDEVLVGGRNS